MTSLIDIQSKLQYYGTVAFWSGSAIKSEGYRGILLVSQHQHETIRRFYGVCLIAGALVTTAFLVNQADPTLLPNLIAHLFPPMPQPHADLLSPPVQGTRLCPTLQNPHISTVPATTMGIPDINPMRAYGDARVIEGTINMPMTDCLSVGTAARIDLGNLLAAGSNATDLSAKLTVFPGEPARDGVCNILNRTTVNCVFH